MDLVDVVVACLRRWWVVVPITALAAGVAWSSAGSIEPEYEAAGSTLLIGPSLERREVIADTPSEAESDDPTETQFLERFSPLNPYLSFSGSLSVTAGAIALGLTGQNFQETLGAEGFTGTFSIDLASGSPLLSVVAVGPTAESAARLSSRVFAEISGELNRRQDDADVPDYLRIRSDLVAVSSPYELDGSRTRLIVGILAIGIALAVALALIADSILGRRHASSKRNREGDGGSHREPGAAETASTGDGGCTGGISDDQPAAMSTNR